MADLDDLMAGHEHLRARGRQHVWGIGRHLSGSQVFDYWADPWGNKIEHWTDGDRFDNSVGAQRLGLESLLKVQWGPEPPADFGAVSPISVKA